VCSGVAYVLHESWPKQEKPPTEFVFSIHGQVRPRLFVDGSTDAIASSWLAWVSHGTHLTGMTTKTRIVT